LTITLIIIEFVLCLKVLDFNKIKEYIFNLFSLGEKYLVVEILNHYLQVTVLRADFELKQLRIVRNYFSEIEQLDPVLISKEIGKIFKKIRKPASYRIILNLDSRLATTIYSSVPLVRERAGEVIDEADADNLISQAIWRFFDRQRIKIADKMDVDEMDLLLIDVRIRGVKVDGHKVISPLGFKAKSVEVYFSQTFLARDFLRALREVLSLEKVVLVAEAGTILAHSLSKIFNQEYLFLVNIFPDQTVLYSVSPARFSHLDNYSWGQNNLLRALGDRLAVEPAIARQIIDLHNEDRGSPLFLKRLESVLIAELQLFLNGLESIINRDSAQVYFNSYFKLPNSAFSPRLYSRSNRNFRVVSLSTGFDMENFGFKVKLKKSIVIKNLANLLSVFWELNSFPKEDKLSYLAKRRARWLS
jgi:hypothetical protein